MSIYLLHQARHSVTTTPIPISASGQEHPVRDQLNLFFLSGQKNLPDKNLPLDFTAKPLRKKLGDFS